METLDTQEIRNGHTVTWGNLKCLSPFEILVHEAALLGWEEP